MNNLDLIPDLPVYEEDLKRAREKRLRDGRVVSCFQSMLIDLTNELKLKDAEVVRESGVSFSTYYSWLNGSSENPMAGEELFKIWQFFRRYKPKLSLECLVYGADASDEESA